ncbi:MAG: ParB/RepB/Spo0J family partition protein [Candidatus Omnitrophica bacterium]|nr:ParB/RepB/Spo0J family partition protein [Candidatus Omnitrophota bacterium]
MNESHQNEKKMFRGLGKGLGALIPDTYVNTLQQKKEAAATSAGGVFEVDIHKILPNPDQPRTEFNDLRIEELANSIRERGIVQPLVVKKKGDQYELICGERRFRAAQRLGLASVPVIVKDIADEALLEVALIENIQREDLNPLEEARAFLRLVEERGMSQEEIAKRVGKDRSTVANALRLLRLPDEIRELVLTGMLSEGHARAILGLPTEALQKSLATRIAQEGLSVRQVEDIVQKNSGGKRRAKKLRRLDGQILDLEGKLEKRLGTQVRIFDHKGKGRLEIRYFSLDQLDLVLNVIGVSKD